MHSVNLPFLREVPAGGRVSYIFFFFLPLQFSLPYKSSLLGIVGSFTSNISLSLPAPAWDN